MNQSHRTNPEILPVRERVESLAPDGLRLWAPAKINLNLLVGPRRGDGYHPLDSIVAKLTLFDRVDLLPRPDGRVTLRCEGFDCGPVRSNLAFRAAELLAAGRDVPGADVALDKRIAPGQGLGGGSSDAAAVLAGLDRLWKLGLSDAALGELAGELGSDVPLFAGPPVARMTGRGERLAAAAVHPFVAVLVMPTFACSTAEVYRAFDEHPEAMGAPLAPGALGSGPPSAWRGRLVNQLGPAARTVSPQLGPLWDAVAAAVGPPVHLTGSGSAMFVLCDDEAEAGDVLASLPPEMPARVAAARLCGW